MRRLMAPDMKPPATPAMSIGARIAQSTPAKLPPAAASVSFENCEKSTVISEQAAADLELYEKRYMNIATFSGPPPIPRNDAIIPSTSPEANTGTAPFKSRDVMRSLFFMYSSMDMTTIKSMIFCVLMTNALSGAFDAITENIFCPARPPATDPSATVTATSFFISMPLCIFLHVETSSRSIYGRSN